MSSSIGPGAVSASASPSLEHLPLSGARVLGVGAVQRDFGHHIATNGRGELLVAARLDPLDHGAGDSQEGPESEDATVDLSAAELRKLTPEGNVAWCLPLRATRLLRAPEVALDDLGSAYVVGPYSPVKGALRGAHHVTLTKIAPSGAVEWSRPLAKVQVVRGALDAPIARVAADPAGGACVTWIREGERYPALRVYRCTREGSVAWDHAWPVTGTAQDPRVGLDAAGAVVVWGTFQGNIEFDSETYTSSAVEASYLARVQADGQVRWARGIRGQPDMPHATAVTEDGTIGRACLVPATTGKAPDAPPLLALFRTSASGDALKPVQGRLGKHAGVSALRLAALDGGGFALAGYFSGSLAIGGVELQSVTPASEALFVALAPRDQAFMTRVFQGPQLQGGLSIHRGAEGSALLCGWFCGSMVLGSHTIESPNDRAALFVAKLGPS